MFTKEYLRQVALPALVFFVQQCFFTSIATLILEEFIVYCCCWALVLRKGKSTGFVWINYIAWMAVFSIGAFA